MLLSLTVYFFHVSGPAVGTEFTGYVGPGETVVCRKLFVSCLLDAIEHDQEYVTVRRQESSTNEQRDQTVANLSCAYAAQGLLTGYIPRSCCHQAQHFNESLLSYALCRLTLVV